MAHLTCVEHGRRSIVADYPNPNPGLRGSIFKILHRGDREPCHSPELQHGRVKISPITVILRMIEVHKKSQGSNWTEPSNTAAPKRRKTRRR